MGAVALGPWLSLSCAGLSRVCAVSDLVCVATLQNKCKGSLALHPRVSRQAGELVGVRHHLACTHWWLACCSCCLGGGGCPMAAAPSAASLPGLLACSAGLCPSRLHGAGGASGRRRQPGPPLAASLCQGAQQGGGGHAGRCVCAMTALQSTRRLCNIAPSQGASVKGQCRKFRCEWTDFKPKEASKQ